MQTNKDEQRGMNNDKIINNIPYHIHYIKQNFHKNYILDNIYE